jgi:demethylmenaquinone methyltransferase/2-methoxy-6-polyprenyl-1,4-benzoquinol methylase
MAVTGAKPLGALDESSAANAVRQMFNSIAPRYDLLNHVLSANIDRLWWNRTARRFRTSLAEPNAAVLDICCGTGDMTMALLKHRPAGTRPILAADFARAMLVRGARKFGGRGAIAIEADAMHLPLNDKSLDLIVTAFGFRNLANYEAGLREFHRVLKPGGAACVLEITRPAGRLSLALLRVYMRGMVPFISRLTARTAQSPLLWQYYWDTIEACVPPERVMAAMREAGFADVKRRVELGVFSEYTGRKPAA